MKLRSERRLLGLRRSQSDDETTIDEYVMNHWGCSYVDLSCFVVSIWSVRGGIVQYIFEKVTLLDSYVFANAIIFNVKISLV